MHVWQASSKNGQRVVMAGEEEGIEKKALESVGPSSSRVFHCEWNQETLQGLE